MLRVTILACLALGLAAAHSSECPKAPKEKEENSLQWTGASFKWPCESTKAIFKSSGKYVSKNAIATRSQIYKDEVFLAIPRLRSGIAATLVTTPLKKHSCHATLTPFPCWSMQEVGNCDALQSVVDLFMDPQEILWVLDTGVTSSLEHPIRRCPPKVIAFDPKTKKVLKKLDLSGLVCAASRLQYLVVDYAPDGRCFVYVSDAATRAILVFDVAAGKGYRVVLPKAITDGCNRRNVLYIALVRKACGNNVLYFSYLSSSRLFSIKTEYLRRGSCHGRVHDVGVKPHKIVILGTDGGCAIFFRYKGQSQVYRWDTNTAFKSANFTSVFKSATCFLATQAMPDLKRSKMRVLESNFPDYIKGQVGCGAYQVISPMEGCF